MSDKKITNEIKRKLKRIFQGVEIIDVFVADGELIRFTIRKGEHIKHITEYKTTPARVLTYFGTDAEIRSRLHKIDKDLAIIYRQYRKCYKKVLALFSQYKVK